VEGQGGVAFEVERLEVTGKDRLEVAGRWTGVRGLRFVRPSLIVRSDGRERSVLAVLDHKPWAPEEGRSWIAAFPWAGGPVDRETAQLAVAPSIVVPLAAVVAQEPPPPRRRGRQTLDTLREELEEERARIRRLEAEIAFLREQRELLTARVAEAEANDGRAAAAEAAADAERRAREEADAVARTEREAALMERDAAAAELRELRTALDAARRDRDAMRRARDEAFTERDAAVAGRDAARAVARKPAGDPHGNGPAPVSPFSSTSMAGADWVSRALIAGVAICLLLLLVGLVRVL
jgi:hypothetical protein